MLLTLREVPWDEWGGILRRHPVSHPGLVGVHRGGTKEKGAAYVELAFPPEREVEDHLSIGHRAGRWRYVEEVEGEVP